MSWFTNFFKKEKKFKIPRGYEFLEKYDSSKPINFGWKTHWCAVKSNDYKEVAEFIGLDITKECNWVEGTIRANGSEVFVLPSINNWVLIHGAGFPLPSTNEEVSNADFLLNRLSKKYNEAQLLGAYRTSSVAFWFLSKNGKIQRAYIVDENGSKIMGEPTEVEKQWDLYDSNSPQIDDEEYMDSLIYPDEEIVLEVAEAWSINPMKLEGIEDIGSTGIYGKIK